MKWLIVMQRNDIIWFKLDKNTNFVYRNHIENKDRCLKIWCISHMMRFGAVIMPSDAYHMFGNEGQVQSSK